MTAVSLELDNGRDRLSLDALLGGSQGVQALVGATGFGAPPVQSQWVEGAADGALYRGSRTLPRDIDLPILIGAEDREQLKAELSRLMLMLSGPCTLRFSDDTGEAWELFDVVRVGGGDYVYGVDANADTDIRTVITLRAGDPYWTSTKSESKQVRTQGGRGLLPELSKLPVSSGQTMGEMVLENTGDVPAAPRWRIEGPGKNVQLESPSGEKLRWEGTLGAGEVLDIDTQKSTIIDGTGANRYESLAEAPRFWKIPPGVGAAAVSMEETSPGVPQPDVLLATNLATNPSFEATGSTVEVMRNYCPNPSMKNTTAYWTAPLGGGLSATHNGIRATVAEGSPAGPYLYNDRNFPVDGAGETWTGSMEVTIPSGAPAQILSLGIRLYGSTDKDSPLTSVSVASGETVRLYTDPIESEAGHTGGRLILRIRTTIVGGPAVMIASRAIIVKGAHVPPYFDGSYSPDSDLTPSWAGTVNNSASVLTGTRASGFFDSPEQRVAIRSQQWAVGGGSSLRVIRTSGTPSQAGAGATLAVSELPDGVYTALVWCHIPEGYDASEDGYSNRAIYLLGDSGNYTQAPSESGTYLLRHVFTKSGGTSLRLGGGGAAGQSVYWDDLTIVEGEYDGPPFDGSTRDGSNFVHAWLGAPNASASTRHTAKRVGQSKISCTWAPRKWAII